MPNIKCKICGTEFPALVERHYIARDLEKTGLAAAFNSDESGLFDAFDCPNCGCQVIAQQRKPFYNQLISIRKNLEIVAKMAVTHEKAERIKIGVSSPNNEFPEYKRSVKKDDDIIAVDFDGTLCIDAWPDIGEPIQSVIDYVKYRQANGARIILWTNRVGKALENAVKWCEENGVVLSAVNENLPEIIEAFGGDTRKIFANEYLDDRALTPEILQRDIYVKY